MNPLTTEFIEPFYVQRVKVSVDGPFMKEKYNLFDFHGDISTSQNPSFSFKFPELKWAIKTIRSVNIEVEDSDDNFYKRIEQIL